MTISSTIPIPNTHARTGKTHFATAADYKYVEQRPVRDVTIYTGLDQMTEEKGPRTGYTLQDPAAPRYKRNVCVTV